MTEQSRPKPIELVARAIYEDRNGRGCVPWSRYPHKIPYRKDAEAAFSILIKHGCSSIEGIIARDEELARVAPVPERAGET